MAKRKIKTQEEFDMLCALLGELTVILRIIGVVELKISKKEKEIYWDTEGGGMIDPLELDRFSHLVENYFLNIAHKGLEELENDR
jgi:hypothetical protein